MILPVVSDERKATLRDRLQEVEEELRVAKSLVRKLGRERKHLRGIIECNLMYDPETGIRYDKI